jgi:hypothetical protein
MLSQLTVFVVYLAFVSGCPFGATDSNLSVVERGSVEVDPKVEGTLFPDTIWATIPANAVSRSRKVPQVSWVPPPSQAVLLVLDPLAVYLAFWCNPNNRHQASICADRKIHRMRARVPVGFRKERLSSNITAAFKEHRDRVRAVSELNRYNDAVRAEKYAFTEDVYCFTCEAASFCAKKLKEACWWLLVGVLLVIGSGAQFAVNSYEMMTRALGATAYGAAKSYVTGKLEDSAIAASLSVLYRALYAALPVAFPFLATAPFGVVATLSLFCMVALMVALCMFVCSALQAFKVWVVQYLLVRVVTALVVKPVKFTFRVISVTCRIVWRSLYVLLAVLCAAPAVYYMVSKRFIALSDAGAVVWSKINFCGSLSAGSCGLPWGTATSLLSARVVLETSAIEAQVDTEDAVQEQERRADLQARVDAQEEEDALKGAVKNFRSLNSYLDSIGDWADDMDFSDGEESVVDQDSAMMLHADPQYGLTHESEQPDSVFDEDAAMAAALKCICELGCSRLIGTEFYHQCLGLAPATRTAFLKQLSRYPIVSYPATFVTATCDNPLDLISAFKSFIQKECTRRLVAKDKLAFVARAAFEARRRNQEARTTGVTAGPLDKPVYHHTTKGATLDVEAQTAPTPPTFPTDLSPVVREADAPQPQAEELPSAAPVPEGPAALAEEPKVAEEIPVPPPVPKKQAGRTLSPEDYQLFTRLKKEFQKQVKAAEAAKISAVKDTAVVQAAAVAPVAKKPRANKKKTPVVGVTLAPAYTEVVNKKKAVKGKAPVAPVPEEKVGKRAVKRESQLPAAPPPVRSECQNLVEINGFKSVGHFRCINGEQAIFVSVVHFDSDMCAAPVDSVAEMVFPHLFGAKVFKGRVAKGNGSKEIAFFALPMIQFTPNQCDQIKNRCVAVFSGKVKDAQPCVATLLDFEDPSIQSTAYSSGPVSVDDRIVSYNMSMFLTRNGAKTDGKASCGTRVAYGKTYMHIGSTAHLGLAEELPVNLPKFSRGGITVNTPDGAEHVV